MGDILCFIYGSVILQITRLPVYNHSPEIVQAVVSLFSFVGLTGLFITIPVHLWELKQQEKSEDKVRLKFILIPSIINVLVLGINILAHSSTLLDSIWIVLNILMVLKLRLSKN